jgi:hypothetical protein
VSAALIRLAGRILPAGELSGETVERMYAVYAAHYDACDATRFRADLAAKDYVILLEDAAGLRGFSTAAHYRFPAAGGPVAVLFSGDTVIDRSVWGQQALSRSFARLAGALHAREQSTSLYWLLISKGHRTYRYLNVFARRFFPHPDFEDGELAGLAREIAAARFGAAYDPRAGVVAFAQSQGHLKADLAQVPARAAGRAEVAYFLQRNPGYRIGHELVCLTRLAPDNLRALVRDEFERGIRHGLA